MEASNVALSLTASGVDVVHGSERSASHRTHNLSLRAVATCPHEQLAFLFVSSVP